MEFIPADIDQYCLDHTTPENDLLSKLNRETHAKVLQSRMLSGHLQGRLLAMVSQMIQPGLILEIGTYTGYSALCLAEGLTQNGKIITIDVNEELEDFVRNFFAQSPLHHKIDFRIGNALEIIPEMEGPFDLVFIDADKLNYQRYYDIVFDKVRPGGYIIADNVLWSGKVSNPAAKDKDTLNIRAFNDAIHNDNRVENILLPIRDGLLVLRKK
ncbi:O-methyltransferase [Emticicia sp. TH156]|uniref:O-methyltransferase n=1 Tax=Emticicia sp. TH156 TaxID=2067454 RepID=UPI000C78830C|nr:O-methyltransferase [Emticicia sp. TH156]PLK44269.1 methyltransferase [Emticicia sp. TH156]